MTEEIVCPACQGSRLNRKALSARIMQTNIAECSLMSLDNLKDWLTAINVSKVAIITEELVNKISNLQTVGLGYLSLDRSTVTLSGGEAQRLKLANYLNSPLNDVLYIFDEPSTGLHPHDVAGINQIFLQLRDQGNTVVIVDHDPDIIKIADQIFNLGELAGKDGGSITYEGPTSGLLSSQTLTGTYLRNRGQLISPKQVRNYSAFYTLTDVSQFNISHLSAKFPQNALSVVTGVAGSGKSTLIDIFKEKYPTTIILDQKPIHSSIRSNVLTFLGVFDKLRRIFATATGQPSSMFSYNGKGACPVCKGRGIIKLDLAYMGDTSEICEACGGKRYSKETLKLKYHGYSIADVLDLSITAAAQLFTGDLAQALNNLVSVDLGYIKLGQSLDTFSGGELQRVKLAKLLLHRQTNILVLDEPTSGLHEANVQNLINLLKKLIKKQNLTIIVIEHNLRIMGQADWLVDIGPFAGKQGGKLLFQGYPYKLVQQNNTLTAQAMHRYFID